MNTVRLGVFLRGLRRRDSLSAHGPLGDHIPISGMVFLGTGHYKCFGGWNVHHVGELARIAAVNYVGSCTPNDAIFCHE